MTIRCPSCDASNERNRRHCVACGAPLAASDATSAPPGRVDGDAARPAAIAPLSPGTVLAGRYRLVALLGRGGMGEVYRADDLKLGQTVALKFLPEALAADAGMLQRFYSEVRLGRQVSHPNVCRLYDLIEIEGRHCLSMEFVDGEDLATLLARIGHLPADKVLDIARELCAGLAAAHDRGVIHRDLKPANILIDGKGHARIADFGIAALVGQLDRRELAGTTAYLAPELIDGEPASVRSDLYALGLVLYEACTGRRRFEARSLAELKRLQAEAELDTLESQVLSMPPALEQLVLACLRRDPDRRPASAQAALAQLPAVDVQPTTRATGRTPTPARVMASRVGNLRLRQAWPWLLTTAAALLVLVAFAWRGLPDRKPGPAASAPAAALGAASTAVLPFVNLSGKKDNEYFSDGLTETLLDRLARVQQLKVIARTSSFRFKGRTDDIRRIGAALGVATLVEGSVQQSGDTLRITAQLVRVSDGSHLWSQQYDRPAKDLFAIQDEIASEVTTALVGKLVPRTAALLRKGGTRDLAAYDAYIQGHQALARITLDSFKQAETLLKQALVRDPDYVEAMLDLVQTWGWLQDFGDITATEFQARADPVLRRIESLDPENARALALRGWVEQTLGNPVRAKELVDRAVAAAPNDAGVRMNTAGVYWHQNDLEGALRHWQHMAGLNPLDPFAHGQLAGVLAMLGRLDEAEQAARRSLRLEPDYALAMQRMAVIANIRGDLSNSIVWARRLYALDSSDPLSALQMADQLENIGEHAAADAWVARSQRLKPGNFAADYFTAHQQFLRGNSKAAFERSLALIPRRAEDNAGQWSASMRIGCWAAQQLGRLPEMRAALVRAGALPPELDVASFKAWTGPAVSGKDKLDELAGFGPCLFDQSPDDARRRAQLRELIGTVEGEGWEARGSGKYLSALLRDDRNAIVTQMLSWEHTPLNYLRSYARGLGVAGDPRLVERFAQLQARIDAARASLPAALARENVSMWPPGDNWSESARAR